MRGFFLGCNCYVSTPINIQSTNGAKNDLRNSFVISHNEFLLYLYSQFYYRRIRIQMFYRKEGKKSAVSLDFFARDFQRSQQHVLHWYHTNCYTLQSAAIGVVFIQLLTGIEKKTSVVVCTGKKISQGTNKPWTNF